jgi:hypothetical protein
MRELAATAASMTGRRLGALLGIVVPAFTKTSVLHFAVRILKTA